MFCVQTGQVVSVSGLQWVSLASGFSQQSGTSCFASVIWQNAIGETDTIPVKKSVKTSKICVVLRTTYRVLRFIVKKCSTLHLSMTPLSYVHKLVHSYHILRRFAVHKT